MSAWRAFTLFYLFLSFSVKLARCPCQPSCVPPKGNLLSVPVPWPQGASHGPSSPGPAPSLGRMLGPCLSLAPAPPDCVLCPTAAPRGGPSCPVPLVALPRRQLSMKRIPRLPPGIGIPSPHPISGSPFPCGSGCVTGRRPSRGPAPPPAAGRAPFAQAVIRQRRAALRTRRCFAPKGRIVGS